ncbi:MAG: bifunctional nuclease family protein [Anaerolineae bacterium]|nr:bifunctional nuclease family protein [Anaerolineae bacterium]
MIRVEIDSIRVSLMSQDRVVVLRDHETERYLPIWIGPFEAEAIRVELQGVEVTRPLTHDLLKSVIKALGGELEHIFVNDLRNDTFFARLLVKANGRELEIDSRPSDAIALAVRMKVPIYVAEAVMDKAAIRPEAEVSDQSSTAPEREASSESEGEDLGVFKDFLENLDLDDLDDK